MKIISNRASDKRLKGDSFLIAQQAKAAKQAGIDALDATLGTFFYDDSDFKGFKTVKKILNLISDEDYFSYAHITGGESFASAVLNWVFGAERSEIEKHHTVRVTPTPGGTGAISSTVYLALDSGETLLIPDLSWGPYVGIAANYGINIEKYTLFSENKFNFTGFKEKCEAVISKQNKLAVIINDPCQNPSGYTLTEDELYGIIMYLNEKTAVPCLLLYDIAYLDYTYEGDTASRRKFRILAEAKPHILAAITFSASKSFCVYGQRLGAQILMSKNEPAVTKLHQAETFYARHCWSNTNHAIISMMNVIDRHDDLKTELRGEIAEVVAQLKRRSEVFLSEAKEVGLSLYPYHSGFFVTIPCNNNERKLKELQEKEHLYCLPFHKSLRIALCALPLDKVKGLAARIKKVL